MASVAFVFINPSLMHCSAKDTIGFVTGTHRTRVIIYAYPVLTISNMQPVRVPYLSATCIHLQTLVLKQQGIIQKNGKILAWTSVKYQTWHVVLLVHAYMCAHMCMHLSNTDIAIV